MRFVEEIVVDAFLPTLRSMLAEELRDRGFTQAEVAEALGISQSAVSKYAHGEVTRNERVLTDQRVRDLVERVADGLAAGDMSRVQALVEIEVLIRQLERGDLLAELHEEAMPELASFEGSFDVHDAESSLRASEQVLASVRRGLRALTTASGFAALIPNVGSNLVECLPEATDIEDVAGVPGRIFDVKGRATVPGDPEFGVSEHVASVLLSAREAGAGVRAALNVRYSEEIVDALRAAGYETVEFDAEAASGPEYGTDAARTDREGDPILAALATVAVDEGPIVLYQTGGQGIEPIVYVLAADAPAAAEVVAELL
ncbi:MAG: thiamine-phosphate synthase family protein [Haloferacaceae archaeon]